MFTHHPGHESYYFLHFKVNKVVVQLIFLLLPTISLYYQQDLLQCDSFYALGWG